ncbi:unnamed protein product [Allacma fusca]|uniref:Tetraspanin n=1 Tax=Allacma fusca TaxID=39272 RepID=A0A8J2KEH3_9HEXA|nr:unnamed protein product [Allacma fusca]
MSRCYGCMKFGVILVAFFFVLIGLAVVALSAYLLLDPNDQAYREITRNDEYLYYGKIFLLVSGALMLLGGILGCCGGFKQSSPCLSLFLAIVLIISMAELAAGVYAYVNRDDFINYFNTLLENSVKHQYRREEVITNAWNLIQKEMECCGAKGYRDFQGSKGDVLDMTIGNHNPAGYFTIPASCCVDSVTETCEDMRVPVNDEVPKNILQKIHQEGCSKKLIELVNGMAYWIIAALIIVGSVQMLCLLFTCILICAFRTRRTYKN